MGLGYQDRLGLFAGPVDGGLMVRLSRVRTSLFNAAPHGDARAIRQLVSSGAFKEGDYSVRRKKEGRGAWWSVRLPKSSSGSARHLKYTTVVQSSPV